MTASTGSRIKENQNRSNDFIPCDPIFYLYTNYFLKKYFKPWKLFFLMFKLWIIQQFGSLLASGRYEDWCKFPYGRPVTTTFILRKDEKKSPKLSKILALSLHWSSILIYICEFNLIFFLYKYWTS